jgi:hypothetical protein
MQSRLPFLLWWRKTLAKQQKKVSLYSTLLRSIHHGAYLLSTTTSCGSIISLRVVPSGIPPARWEGICTILDVNFREFDFYEVRE